jgi:hypothetical protein
LRPIVPGVRTSDVAASVVGGLGDAAVDPGTGVPRVAGGGSGGAAGAAGVGRASGSAPHVRTG